MKLVFEDGDHAIHRFDAFSFQDPSRIPPVGAPYLLLAVNRGPDSPASHSVIYAGESRDCRARCESHAKDRAKFQRGAAATVSDRHDTGMPALVLIAADWRPFVTPSAGPRQERMEYEERLKFLFSPICDFQARHLTAHRGGRRFRPGNHLVSVKRKTGRLVYAQPGPSSWPDALAGLPAEGGSALV